MTKAALREIYKTRRNELTLAQQSDLDDCILANLQHLDWSKVRMVHLYLPIGKYKEPDTLKFRQWLIKAYPEITFVISRSDMVEHKMIHYLWDDQSLLASNYWGISEPQKGVVVKDVDIDVVLVPLLVVDSRGNRVGYGKGFYDRFLANCRSDVLTIGLSYFEPVDSISDVGEWDVPMKLCVTPRRIYDFSK